MFQFRMPQLKGTEKEQLAQLKSFLYQFLQDLEFALNALEKAQNDIKNETGGNTHEHE